MNFKIFLNKWHFFNSFIFQFQEALHTRKNFYYFVLFQDFEIKNCKIRFLYIKTDISIDHIHKYTNIIISNLED